MTSPALPGFSVLITNLDDGGQLACSTTISVDYAQPASAAPSTVALSTSAAGASVTPSTPQSVSNPSGTLTFTISFSSPTTQTGKTVTATITNNGTVQKTDQKSNISVNCASTTPGGGGD